MTNFQKLKPYKGTPACVLNTLHKLRPLDMLHAELVSKLRKDPITIRESLTPVDCDRIHMTLGICGEAGELLDAIKKAVIYRLPLDRDNVIEELGDIEFYLEGFRQSLDIDRQLTLETNIKKLQKRYLANRYSDKAAKERLDKA